MRTISAKVQLVAFDFDSTIVDVHTWGVWNGTAEELANHVRPDFQCYIARCLDQGLLVSVATFSTQASLISSVLEKAIPHEKATSIPIFGGDDVVKGFVKGKQSQLHLSLEHFRQLSSPQLDVASTVLVDDDFRNINIARRDGYQTIYYKPGSSLFRATSSLDKKHLYAAG